MRILIVDAILRHGPVLAQRLSREGHDVVYAPIWGYLADQPFAEALCSGLPGVKIDPDGWMRWLDWPDVATVTGSEHRGNVVNFLRDKGVPTVGCGRWGASTEMDRGKGFKLMEEMGLHPPRYEVFTELKDAIEYVKKNPARYVMKLDQTVRSLSETFVGRADDATDMIDHLEDLLDAEEDLPEGTVHYYIQEFVPGIEIGVGGIFNGKKFLSGLMASYESFYGFVYDYGIPSEKLVNVGAVEKVLAKHNYRGPMDLNGIWANGEFRPIEWTPRWGGGVTAMFCQIPSNLGELLHAVATGKDVPSRRPMYEGKIFVEVRAFDDSAPEKTYVLYGADKLPIQTDYAGCFAQYPMKNRKGEWILLPVIKESQRLSYNGIGDTLDAALDQVEKLTDEIYFADMSVYANELREEVVTRMRKFNAILKRGEKEEAVEAVYEEERPERVRGTPPQGEDWIKELAEETRHVWGRPLERG